MIGRVINSLFWISAWIGVLYGPADLWGICDTYPSACHLVEGMTRFQLLAALSLALVAWLIYRDWREPISIFRKWLRGKRGLYSVESTTVGHPDGNVLVQRPQAVLRFHKSASTVKITLYVRSLVGTAHEEVQCAGSVVLSDVQRDQTHLVTLGLFDIRSTIQSTHIRSAYWGLGFPAKKPLAAIPGSKNILVLNVNGREHRFFVDLPTHYSAAHRVIIFDQDESWLRLLSEGIGEEKQR